jgi:signal transduction histidine kinase/ligand-binding sensor domain-containing protein/DNA-binding response OmpR family regulator
VKNAIRFCLLCILCGTSLLSFAQDFQPKFKRISTSEGLSQGHVSAILKDTKGFMWFATDEGLNKYDGYQFTIYKNRPDDSTTIVNNYVYEIFEDKDHDLWVGTQSGLDQFDRKRNIFIHYSPGMNINIKDIFQDSKGRMWIGTTEGLYLFNKTSKKFTVYRHNGKANSISHNFVSRITEDNDGTLWIATNDGLTTFIPESNTFFCYKNNPGDKKSIGGNWIKTIYTDSRGNIWAGTQGNGISMYRKKDNSFRNFKHDPFMPGSLSHNDILSFTEDTKGNLLVGTENGGISVYGYTTPVFTYYRNDINDPYSVSNNSIYSLYKDDIGNLWVGTWSGGVNFLPRYGDKFAHYKQTPGNPNSLSNSIVLCISNDSEGNLWIGTDGGGLNKFDRKKGTFTNFRHDDKDPKSIGSDYVLSIKEIKPKVLAIGYHRGGFDFLNISDGSIIHHVAGKNNHNSLSTNTVNILIQDKAGMLWLGTWGGGVDVYDIKNNKFTNYHHNPADSNSVSNNFIHTIHEDKEGMVWIATETGLDRFDRSTNRFIHYRNDPANKHSLSHNMIETIIEDHSGNMWIGTGGGLNLYDRQKNNFTSYTEKDGIANNSIRAIMEDEHGNLWISSNQGITKFDPNTKKCRNYNITDGLQGNEFKARCTFKDPNGNLYFGGSNGFNSFHPDSIKDNDFIPPVFVTGFSIFNKPVLTGKSGTFHLQHDISETNEITLSYKQSVFTFEFASLNYTLPEKNNYAYKLVGFDNDWNYVGNKRSATYTNLNAGKYIFQVKASNNDGIWNTEATSVIVTILPPFWQTWWFKLLVATGIIGSALGFYWYRISSIKKQKLVLQRKVAEQTEQLVLLNEEEKHARIEAENAKQEALDANKAKSIFLATMSHEIRTPMNGVLGMASLLSQTELTIEQRGYAETINSCGESLLMVINDILDYSKIESGKMDLESKDFDLRICLEDVLDVFAGKASQIGLDLLYEIDPAVPALITGDSLRIRQVLMNLVSNAIKFTQKGEILVGVYLSATTNSDDLEIRFEVRDTGIGIPADKIGRLFKAFSQVDSSTTRKYGGTGLGLVICEKLIGLMGGAINVTSKVGEGSVFTFTIRTKEGTQSERTYTLYDVKGLQGRKILVVDDNSTNRLILKKQLEQWEMIPSLAASGEEVLQLLSNGDHFDLLLSDMQMPEMDGIQLATEVKKVAPQLPIILLSSMGDLAAVSKEHPTLFNAVLGKPIKQHILCRHILEQLQPGVRQVKSESKNNDHKLSVDFAKSHPLRMMIAEDNLVNQQLILRVLEMLGYENTTIVENGQLAVAENDRNVYDLILMDVNMPEMDGLEATQIIKMKGLHQPVIVAMTANVMQDDQDECAQAGMDDFISKPIKLDEVMNILKKWSTVVHQKANSAA